MLAPLLAEFRVNGVFLANDAAKFLQVLFFHVQTRSKVVVFQLVKTQKSWHSMMMICFESIIKVNNKNFFISVKDVDKQQKVIISIKQNIDWVKIEKIVCKVARDRTQMFVLVREKCKSSSMMTRWKQKMQVSL